MFISLIIHVDIEHITHLNQQEWFFEGRLKPEKAPNCYRLNGVACGGLKSVSVSDTLPEGFILPLFVTCIGRNGSMMWAV